MYNPRFETLFNQNELYKSLTDMYAFILKQFANIQHKCHFLFMFLFLLFDKNALEQLYKLKR